MEGKGRPMTQRGQETCPEQPSTSLIPASPGCGFPDSLGLSQLCADIAQTPRDSAQGCHTQGLMRIPTSALKGSNSAHHLIP